MWNNKNKIIIYIDRFLLLLNKSFLLTIYYLLDGNLYMEKIKFNENEIIIKLGDTSEYVYVILEGEVGIYLLDKFDEKPNFVLGKNEVFGELGVLNNQLRTSNVKSMTNVELLKISKKDMQKMISESNLFIQGLIRTLSNRVTSYISIVRKHEIKTN